VQRFSGNRIAAAVELINKVYLDYIVLNV